MIRHRAEYEAAREQVERLSGEFAEMPPAFTEAIDARLDREDRALAEMGRGIARVDEVLPAYSRVMSRSLAIGRLLAWLVAAIAGLLGSFLIAGSLPVRRRGAQACPEPANDDNPPLPPTTAAEVGFVAGRSPLPRRRP